ncbi:alpha/beta fold hydrolase [Phenylobacterium sp. VNQ135]|uniref:alpha/beta fold hydrolase n=1 Tax=Phenylobacterium sp. VNQ135 TaxID=3400922 RepID=UPI003C012FC0
MANDLTEKPKSESYDDRPFHTDGLPPEVRAPLAPFNGAEPPAPRWFKDAIADEPERSFVVSHGTKLELLTWGELGKPGLLLVHGNSAHADWWSFIAPFLAKDYRVAAFSLAGMGESEWRARYAFADFAGDAEACARAAGLYESGSKPIYIGHSFGGAQVFFASVQNPDQMQAAILVDTGFGGPPPEVLEERKKRAEQVRNIPTADRPSRVYATLEQALGRFRLMPPQPAGNLFVADFIARRSLKRAPLPDGSGDGWTWKFDPTMWEKLDRTNAPSHEPPPPINVPMVHIYGAQSRIIERRKAGERSFFGDRVREIEIPESEHHIMIDQPLALVASLRTLLATWPD